MAILIEQCKISPPSNMTGECSLPIVFFDMLWYDFMANQSVLFFKFPCSKSHFLEVIVPDLKKSLSSTLGQFLPLAGNIIHPLNPENKPILSYLPGDSVCLTVSESESDFSHLTGNHPRVSDDFYDFAPNLPSATNSDNSTTCPVLALQVTLFPEQGICIGFVTHHVVADASTVLSFMKAWALINSNINSQLDSTKITRLMEANCCLPFYDRRTVVGINGLDSLYWDLIVKLSCPIEPPRMKFPIGKVRSTFVLKKDEIQKLKKFVSAKRPRVSHLSSFTVTCALVWICSAKAAAIAGVDDDETEYFGFVADCRRRLNPPLPLNYFGNCVALVNTELKHGQLKGTDGFLMAVESIGEAISENVYGDKGILHGAQNWSEEYEKLVGKRQIGVAGSPRFDFYAADFGWGRPNKFEALFVDGNGSMSLCGSGQFEGGLEIGLSKPMAEMQIFTEVFNLVLADLLL
ncbi:hypothetical protein ACJIZ3_009100 [Penstemon smallii]|uniref:Uncharacterized protein n=1 Tax=Penstemon smallii TaxID=265156 RepID=A0ABD3TBN6_9LAMI